MCPCVCVCVCVCVHVCVCACMCVLHVCACVCEVLMATPDICNQMFKNKVQVLFIISRFNSLTVGLPRPQRSKLVCLRRCIKLGLMFGELEK